MVKSIDQTRELFQVLRLTWAYFVNCAIAVIIQVISWLITKTAMLLFSVVFKLNSCFPGNFLVYFLSNRIMACVKVESSLYQAHKTKAQKLSSLRVRLNEFNEV
jgi:hypothetical protein